MRNQDLIEMGININWCRVLSAARERLRRECLRGRIFGFTVQGADNVPEQSTTQAEDGEEDIESLFLRLPTSASATSVNQEWNKNSWRRTEGKKSRGRVKGIAKVFESSDIIDVLGRRRSISSREAELDEVSRIRRSRQDSTDSGISTVSSSSTAGGSYLDTCKSPESSSSTHPQQPWDTTISQIDGGRSRTTEASESESEAEDTFGSPANKVNWGAVEPLAIEEMASLPESLFAELSVPSSTSSSPSTPCAATFNLASNTAFKDDSIRKEEGDHLDEGPEKAASYQSRILSHGQHAYAAIRPRKQSDFSEVTDELSAEHLAYWDKQQVEEDQNQPDTTVQHPSHTPPYEQDTPEQVSHAQEVTAKGDSARMVFAESDGNVITMKKQAQSGQMGVGKNIFSKRTRSVEDFGSLKFHTVQSRSSDKSSSNRLMLKDLFEEENNESNKHDTDARTAWKDGGSKRRGWKDSRRLSDLFRNDNESEQYYSLKSRSGSIVILPRAEVEEMQARLKDLEQQLELAKSTSASRASHHSQSSSTASDSVRGRREDAHDELVTSKSQAMSAWVKGALGEANTIVSGGGQEPSWLGLGSWALAAGLGIGIVVGEAVFSKLRR